MKVCGIAFVDFRIYARTGTTINAEKLSDIIPYVLSKISFIIFFLNKRENETSQAVLSLSKKKMARTSKAKTSKDIHIGAESCGKGIPFSEMFRIRLLFSHAFSTVTKDSKFIVNCRAWSNYIQVTVEWL